MAFPPRSLAALVVIVTGSTVAAAPAPIIGGAVDTGDPAVVLLAAYPSDHSTLFTCTAVVIAPTALLTAAHCVDHPGYSFGVFFGPDASPYTTLALLLPHLEAVTAVHAHPSYVTTAPYYADLAVVNLAQATSIPPIAFVRDVPGAALVGSPARIIGFGQIVYNQFNAERYAATTTIAAIDAVDTITVGDAQRHTCVGDSGGPALIPALTGEVLIGIDSYADTTGCTGAAHFRRTDLFATFIDQYAGTMPPAGGPDAGVTAGPDAGTVHDPGDGGGCATTGGSSSWLVVGAMLALVRRRRR